MDNVGDHSQSRQDPPEAPDPAGRPRRLSPRLAAALLVVVASVAAAGVAAYHERHALADALTRMGPAMLAGSLAAAVIGVGLTFFAWHAVCRGLDVHIPTAEASRVFFTSQLGKYLPGSVWPVLMQMDAAGRHGASRRSMLSANLITLAIGCTSGLVIAGAVLPFADSAAFARYWWLMLALPLLLPLLHPRVVPWALDRVLVLLGRDAVDARLAPGDAVRALGWTVASWLFEGLHLAVLVYAVGGRGVSTFVLCLGGLALAVSAGVLFIPAPAGAGMRDVVLQLVLTSVLAAGPALAVVLASRAILVLADLVLAGVAGAARRSPPLVSPSVG